MMPDPNVFGPATLAMTQGVAAFMTFLPRLSDVRKATPATDPDLAADVRMGEVAASTLTLGIGVMVSSLTGSPVPTVIALITCAVLVGLYESTLCANNPMQTTSIRLVRVENA